MIVTISSLYLHDFLSHFLLNFLYLDQFDFHPYPRFFILHFSPCMIVLASSLRPFPKSPLATSLSSKAYSVIFHNHLPPLPALLPLHPPPSSQHKRPRHGMWGRGRGMARGKRMGGETDEGLRALGSEYNLNQRTLLVVSSSHCTSGLPSIGN